MSSLVRILGSLLPIATCGLAVAACGGATEYLPPPQQPTASFAPYQAFELKLAGLPPALAADEVATKVAVKVSENLAACLAQVLPNLTAPGASAPASLPTLVIEPTIEDLRIVRAATRVFVGRMAGDSAIYLRVTFRDRASGTAVASPQFVRGSDARSGAYSVGVSDNLMLSDIAVDVCDYAAAARALAAPQAAAPAPTAAPPPDPSVPSPFEPTSAPAQPAPAAQPAASSENTAEACRDSADNDGDGAADCADQDCAAFCAQQ